MLAFLAAALAAAPASPIAPVAIAPETPAASAAPAAPPAPAPALENSVPWWEKVTVTVDDKGKQQSCFYEASHFGGGPTACDPKMAAGLDAAGGEGPAGVFTKMTFERRFSPGEELDGGQLQPGDTLLARQVMFLTFDPAGAIQSCEVVATAGERRPAYGCDEAKKEQFRTQASTGPAPRQAFMTILAYGHQEQIA